MSQIFSHGSTRPDSSWVTGQVVFSNGKGVWLVGVDGANPTLFGGTSGMIYPTWFPIPPLYQALAVYNEQPSTSPLPNTNEIDVDGNLIATALLVPPSSQECPASIQWIPL